MFHSHFFTRRNRSEHAPRRLATRRTKSPPFGRSLRLEPLEERQMLSLGSVPPVLADSAVALQVGQQVVCTAAAGAVTPQTTTDTTPPTVASTLPSLAGGSITACATAFSVTFSEPVVGAIWPRATSLSRSGRRALGHRR